MSPLVVLFCFFMAGVVSAQMPRYEDTVSKHYSVAREIKLYTGLDLSLYAEDLRCHVIKGDETKIMVRFDIHREQYAHLVKINENSLGGLEGVSSKDFENRLVEYRKTLPDKAWFWELLEYRGPFFCSTASGGGESCDVFAVSGTEEILRVILVCQGTNRIELAEEVLLYTGLKLPAHAENIKFEVVPYEEPYYHGKTAFVRLELGEDQPDETAEFLTDSHPYSLNTIYKDISPKGYYNDITPKDHIPEWWKIAESERFEMDCIEDKEYGRIAFVPHQRRAWFLPLPSGSNLFYMQVHIRLRTHQGSVEESTGICFPGSIYNVKRHIFSTVAGDFIYRFRFDTRKDNLVEALDNAAHISFKYADLKTDRKTLEVYAGVGYPVEKSKIEFWEEQLGLTRFVCASEREPGLPEGQFRNHYICVTPLDNDNVRVYFMDNGGSH